VSLGSSQNGCREVGRLVSTFVDGQLDPVSMVEVEEHIASCALCKERVLLDKATRVSVKKAVSSVELPGGLDAFASRAKASMLASAALDDLQAKEKKASTESRIFGWRTTLPLATAAAIALMWGVVSSHGPAGGKSAKLEAGFGNDFLSDIVAEHSRPLPPERTDPKELRAFERYVGVPVHPPVFSKKPARFLGGRVLPVHHERAAMLQYELGDGAAAQRVSVFIYDPKNLHIGGMQPHPVGTADVQVGQADGYSVAVTQHAGVAYAVASDMDPAQIAEFAATAETY